MEADQPGSNAVNDDPLPFANLRKAIAVAETHLARDPFPDAEYKWVLTEPIRLEDGWYFAYGVERIDGRPDDGGFGGAPGFMVAFRDGSVRIVSNEEYGDRKLWLRTTTPLPPDE